MNALLEEILDAHGGTNRWHQFHSLEAHLIQGGALWALKGHASRLDDTRVTVDLTRQAASHHPFGRHDLKSQFTPDRVDLVDAQGRSIETLLSPRDSFAGHELTTPWTGPQLAYFAGYAMWTYLNLPFLLAWPGVATEQLEPFELDGVKHRRLRFTLPPQIVSHCAQQTLYVDESGLIVRHDYDVEISGNTPAVHWVSHYITVAGIKFPTRHRIYPRAPDGSALTDPLVVSIDVDEITLA
jgi:hypothetical protein